MESRVGNLIEICFDKLLHDISSSTEQDILALKTISTQLRTNLGLSKINTPEHPKGFLAKSKIEKRRKRSLFKGKITILFALHDRVSEMRRTKNLATGKRPKKGVFVKLSHHLV